MSQRTHVELDVVKAALAEALERIDGRSTSEPDYLGNPNDRGPKLRPHGAGGKFGWQLWTGHMCIALLSHEDVQPVLDRYLAEKKRSEGT